jgi:hypothetical protein
MDRPPEERIDFASLEKLSPTAPPPKEKSGSGITKAVAFLVPLVILAAVPWVLLTKVFKTPERAPSPVVERTHSPPPSASPTTNPAKGTYEVSGLHGASCLRIHVRPGTGTAVIDCLQTGLQVTSDGQTAKADSYPWLHVHDPIKRADGWAAATYLKKVP